MFCLEEQNMGMRLNKQYANMNLELINMNRSMRNKSNGDNVHDFEECILIWLDSTLRDIDQWSDEINHIRKISNHLKIFHNPNDCITFMKMVVIDKIFLIVSQ